MNGASTARMRCCDITPFLRGWWKSGKFAGGMTTLDIVILVVLVASLAIGFRKGIIVQAGSLGGIVLGVVLCRLFGIRLAAIIAGAEAPGYIDSVLANVILFIGGFLSVKLVAHFCKQLTHALALGGLDRLAGALFGLFKWMLVLSILLNLWVMVKPGTDVTAMSTLGNGHAIEAIMGLAPAVLGWAIN